MEGDRAMGKDSEGGERRCAVGKRLGWSGVM